MAVAEEESGHVDGDEIEGGTAHLNDGTVVAVVVDLSSVPSQLLLLLHGFPVDGAVVVQNSPEFHPYFGCAPCLVPWDTYSSFPLNCPLGKHSVESQLGCFPCASDEIRVVHSASESVSDLLPSCPPASVGTFVLGHHYAM